MPEAGSYPADAPLLILTPPERTITDFFGKLVLADQSVIYVGNNVDGVFRATTADEEIVRQQMETLRGGAAATMAKDLSKLPIKSLEITDASGPDPVLSLAPSGRHIQLHVFPPFGQTPKETEISYPVSDFFRMLREGKICFLCFSRPQQPEDIYAMIIPKEAGSKDCLVCVFQSPDIKNRALHIDAAGSALSLVSNLASLTSQIVTTPGADAYRQIADAVAERSDNPRSYQQGLSRIMERFPKTAGRYPKLIGIITGIIFRSRPVRLTRWHHNIDPFVAAELMKLYAMAVMYDEIEENQSPLLLHHEARTNATFSPQKVGAALFVESQPKTPSEEAQPKKRKKPPKETIYTDALRFITDATRKDRQLREEIEDNLTQGEQILTSLLSRASSMIEASGYRLQEREQTVGFLIIKIATNTNTQIQHKLLEAPDQLNFPLESTPVLFHTLPVIERPNPYRPEDRERNSFYIIAGDGQEYEVSLFLHINRSPAGNITTLADSGWGYLDFDKRQQGGKAPLLHGIDCEDRHPIISNMFAQIMTSLAGSLPATPAEIAWLENRSFYLTGIVPSEGKRYCVKIDGVTPGFMEAKLYHFLNMRDEIRVERQTLPAYQDARMLPDRFTNYISPAMGALQKIGERFNHLFILSPPRS